VAYDLMDLSELVARLGSCNVWDRQGTTLFETKFDEGMGEVDTGFSGTTAAHDLMTGYSRQGAYCMRLTAAHDDEHWADVSKLLCVQLPSRFGLEIAFSVEANTESWELRIEWSDATQEWQGTLRYMHGTGNIDVIDNTGVVFTLATIGLLFDDDRVQYKMKLVIDAVTGEYVRAIVNDTVYPSSLMLPPPAGPGPGLVDPGAPAFAGLSLYMRHTGVIAFNPEAYLDCIIVTQQEP